MGCCAIQMTSSPRLLSLRRRAWVCSHFTTVRVPRLAATEGCSWLPWLAVALGGGDAAFTPLFQNISSVVAAFSDLLHVRVPNSYEVSNGPDVPSVGLVSSHRVNPGLECRQHIFLRGPPPGSANPPRSASSYRLKPPSVPFRPASDGELLCVPLTSSSPLSPGLSWFSLKSHFSF